MKKTSSFIFLLFAFSKFAPAQEKPSLSVKDLEKSTYYFEMVNDTLAGDGATFLKLEMKKHQYVLLGEYHGSFQISKFTKAIIPILDDAGFRNFGLEIGPVSVEILKELSKDPAKTISNLNAFNSQFCQYADNRTYTAIPFFSNVEDAAFLTEAAKRNWNLMGFDQEFLYGYLPLLERMYHNLAPKSRKNCSELYGIAVNAVRTAYAIDSSCGKPCFETISESAGFGKFLDEASVQNAANQKIASAIRTTTDIYMKSVKRKYLEQNSNRVAYMKQNLAAAFTKNKFDLRKDKMLLKMGAVHTGRGFSPLSLFEIGNTLGELAEFNGNKSLHINFNARFYVDSLKEIDELADTTGFSYRFKALFQMARKDKWTVIDLRPLRYNVFYSRSYKLDEIIWEIFKNHDLYILPPLDIDPTPNFTVKKP
jgi:hypothetical protein